MFRVLLLAGGLGLMCVESQAAKVSVPPNLAPVVDGAKLFSADFSASVSQKLNAVYKQTGIQVGVLSVPSLEGLSIEEFSIEVASVWKLGHEKSDKGLLILLAPNERRVRIEVGRGLEGDFTDLQSGRVINDVMIPYFKQGDWESGTAAGLYDILKQLAPDVHTFAEPARRKDSLGRGVSMLITFLMFMFFFALFFGGRGGGGGGGRRRRTSNFVDGLLLGGLLGGGRGSSGGFGGGSSWGGGGGSFGGGGASGSW